MLSPKPKQSPRLNGRKKFKSQTAASAANTFKSLFRPSSMPTVNKGFDEEPHSATLDESSSDDEEFIEVPGPRFRRASSDITLNSKELTKWNKEMQVTQKQRALSKKLGKQVRRTSHLMTVDVNNIPSPQSSTEAPSPKGPARRTDTSPKRTRKVKSSPRRERPASVDFVDLEQKKPSKASSSRPRRAAAPPKRSPRRERPASNPLPSTSSPTSKSPSRSRPSKRVTFSTVSVQEYDLQILKDDDGDLFLSMDWHPSPRKVSAIDRYEQRRASEGRRNMNQYECLEESDIRSILLSGKATLVRIPSFGPSKIPCANPQEDEEGTPVEEEMDTLVTAAINQRTPCTPQDREHMKTFLADIHQDFVGYANQLALIGVNRPSDIMDRRLSEKDLVRARIKMLHARKIIAACQAAKNLKTRVRNPDEHDMAKVWQLGNSLVDLEFFGRMFNGTTA